MEIRLANVRDIEKMLPMCSAMHAESRYRIYHYSQEKMKTLIERMTTDDDSIVLVTERNGETIGMFLATIGTHFFGDDRYSSDGLLYVVPEHRGTKAAKNMVTYYVLWAKSKGVSDIRIGDTTNNNPEQNEKFYQESGFIRIGGNFLYEGGE